MISRIEIKDNTRTPFHYLPKCFDNGTTFDFDERTNIIIGPNGSGKSTLLNAIKKFTLTHRDMYSKLPDKAFLYPNLWGNDREKVELMDGIDIKCDYTQKVFCFKHHTDKDFDIDASGFNFNLGISCSSFSTGEGVKAGIAQLVEVLFNNKKKIGGYDFPIEDIKQVANNCNDLWADRLNLLLGYYERNRIESNGRISILMDEPDRNLDIYNLKELSKILQLDRGDTQIIAVVHNPILILKLANEGLNIIETESGYLDKIRSFIKK